MRVRMMVGEDGRVEPGRLCIVTGPSRWQAREALQTISSWRFESRGPTRPIARAPYEVTLRYSLADTIRAIPGREPTLADVPLAPLSGPSPVVVVPVRALRHGAPVAAPATALPRAARDSAEIAIVLALAPATPFDGGVWCVSPEPDARVLDELQRQRPGARSQRACASPGSDRTTLILNWSHPSSGLTPDGVLLLRAEHQTSTRKGCPAGHGLCGSGHGYEFDCAAAPSAGRWVAECRYTGRKITTNS